MDRQARSAIMCCSICLTSLLTGCSEGPSEVVPDARVPPLELSGRAPSVPITPLNLGEPLSAELSTSAPVYQFSFELSAPARVSLHTQAAVAGPTVDTVLTLARIDQYGLPRIVGTSDDYGHTPFSGLERTLSRGSYRASVRGSTLRVRGPFVLASTCLGAGCPPPPQVCLFGSQFSDLTTSARLHIDSDESLSEVSEITTELMRDQVVLAVQQSSHTEVGTPEQALAAVDQGGVRHLELSETRGERAFSVYEYGVGDNSYGAVFEQGSLVLAASIHDGDFYDCKLSE
ncbi:MAG: hypothetical protein JWN48_2980 [Myxococcaceae bacterium]|nr:hypothetical protein [Myxococcaceae bacterium]